MSAVDDRRHVLAFLTDDLLAWWLHGCEESDEMKEWWTSRDAVDTATELVHSIFQSIEDHGYKIVKAPDAD